MTFNLSIAIVGGQQAQSTVAGVTSGLNAASAAAGQARNALGQFASAGTAAGSRVAAGANQAAAGHAKAKQAVEGHGDALTGLIHLAEAYIAVHQLESVIDGYIEIRNKVNAVSESQANLNGVMDELFRIAQDTRSSWEDLASTYQRVSNASRGLGISQRDTLDLVEELSMGMRLSGSSSREAAMTMMELTHAFTVGTLTGREFRVMMKDAPALMHELQVVSGHTGAEFAEMGKHGKFTAQTLIEWFGKAAPTIREKFGQTLPTIAEGLQQIKNSAEKFFGSAAVGTGVMGQLSAAMRFVADHFETLGKTILAVGEALLTLFVIEKIIGLIRSLTVALAENPVTVLLVAITVGISLLRQFGDELKTDSAVMTETGQVAVTVGDYLRGLWTMIKELGRTIVEFVDVAWHKMTAAFSDGLDSSGIELSLRNVLVFVASFVDAAIGIFRFFGDTLVTIFGGIPTIIADVVTKLVQGVARGVQAAVNTAILGINKLIEAKNAVIGTSTGSTPDAQRDAAFAWASNLNKKYGLQPDRLVGPPPGHAEARAQAEARIRAEAETGIPTVAGVYQPGQAPGGAGGMQAGNLIKPIDLSMNNPYEGSMDAFLQKLKDDWQQDIKGTDYAKDMVSSFMNRLDELARDEAKKRAAAAASVPGSYVKTDHGPAEAPAVDEKALKALERLRNQLREIEEQTNPVTAAQEKLAHAEEVINKAVAAGLITRERANFDMENYRRKLQDALDPLGAWLTKQSQAAAVLRSTSEEQERATQLQTFEHEMKEKGILLTDLELAQATRVIAEQQKRAELMRAEQQFTAQILGPQKAYAIQLEALGDLLEKGTINAEAYGRAVDDVRAAYLAAKPGAKTFSDGLEAGWLVMKREAEDVGAAIAKLALDDIGKLNDAFITAANNGEVAWGKMVESMIQDLEKLLIKQLEVMAITALLNAMVPGAGTVAGASGVSSGIVNALPGFADGGSFMVGGSGGTDSQHIAFMATPGEHVAITPPGRYPYAAAQQQQAAPAAAPVIHNHIHNHYDESVGVAAMKSPAGQQVLLNFMRANPSPGKR